MFKRITVSVALTVTAITAFPACERTHTSGNSAPDEVNSGDRENPPLVQDYLRVADAAGAETTVVDEAFLAGALRKLAAALGTLNLADADLQGALRVAAEHILSSPQSPDTTVAVRNSLVSAAAVIENESGEGTRLRESAASLTPTEPLADQFATIREFILKSGPAVRRAARD